PLFPVLSISAAVIWIALTVLGLLVLWWRSADEQLASSLTAADVQQLTVPFVAGFLLQVLFGAMSYLLPVTLRGGPRSTTAALAAMSRFAVLRVVTYNLALVLFVLAGMGGTAAAALFSALTLGTAEVSSFGSLSVVALARWPALGGVAWSRGRERRRGTATVGPAPPAPPGPQPAAPAAGAGGGRRAGRPQGGRAGGKGAPPAAQSPCVLRLSPRPS